MKVRVSVYLQGTCNYYYFPYDYETFMQGFDGSVAALGYYGEKDEKGRYIIINPSQCSTIEITEFPT